MKYILFKKVAEPETDDSRSIYSMMMGLSSHAISGEEWKSEDAKGKKKSEKIAFVAVVENPKEVLKLVRKDPTEKYLLFYGEVEELTVAMPVFMGGKNLATLTSEWSEQP
jgi:hypothetical protein